MEQELQVADSTPEVSSEVESNDYDVESASSEMASGLADDLFPDRERDEAPEEVEAAPETPETPEPTIDISKPAPKSWPQEMHEHWLKTPKEVQQYWETREKQMLDGLDQYKGDAGFGKQLKDAITPYDSLLQAHGMDAPTAIKSLLNAQYRLTQGTPEQRQAAYRELGRGLGFEEGGTQAAPEIVALQQELNSIKQVIQSGNQEALNAEKTRIANEVSAFAADVAHPYFDEVSDDIITMLKSGASLQDAYEKAVWANPVTRQKEISRLQTEQEKTIREKANAEAAAAKKAASTNIRSRDTRKTPTGPRATMAGLDDALRETQREINSRS